MWYNDAMRRATPIVRACLHAVPLAAMMWCASGAHAATTPLTIKSMIGNVWWTGKGPGMGGFSLLATVPTAITNLQQIAVSQPSFFYRAGWPGLNLWDDWLAKDSGTARTYLYQGKLNGQNFKYSVSLSLSHGMLTIKVNGSVRGYVASMFDLANTTSSGSSSFTFTVDLKDRGGVSVATGSATIQMNYANTAGRKSTAKLHTG